MATRNQCPGAEVRGIFAASAAGAKEATSTRGSASRRCVTERAQEATQASAPVRGPRKIADFAGWAGARPPRPRRCKGPPGQATALAGGRRALADHVNVLLEHRAQPLGLEV